MAKVDIELVKLALQRAKLDTHKAEQIIRDIAFEAQSRKNAEDKEPPCKRQFVVFLRDPDGKLRSPRDLVGWVAQIPEDDEPESAEEKLYAAARHYNLTPKGRRMPLKTVDETCEFGSAKINKEHGLWIRSKEPVLVVPVFNKIPMTEI
ncbi:MAG: hypothetical protein HP060_01400 [Opitutales bacterium]|nr:hypothetical protein [Opitutales bacterium]